MSGAPGETPEVVEANMGAPEDAAGLVYDLAENLDTLLHGYDPEDWRDALRVLRALRRGIERLRQVDAGLVQWLYLHGEHGQHQTLDGLGPFAITRGRSKERWEERSLAHDFVEAKIRANGGEAPDPREVVEWVLELGRLEPRKTPPRAMGMPLEDYYYSEPGTIQVTVPK